jgi:hypothetical protein
MSISGAHTVGVEDGGPGLPVVGWSTVAGDLRVGHFIGLHALQSVPILGILLIRFAPAWLRPSDRVRLIITAGLAYIAITLLATWQALRAQPLLRPDALTLGALAAILLAAGAVAAGVMLRARRADPGTPEGAARLDPARDLGVTA